jgi:hypothetical protein
MERDGDGERRGSQRRTKKETRNKASQEERRKHRSQSKSVFCLGYSSVYFLVCCCFFLSAQLASRAKVPFCFRWRG